MTEIKMRNKFLEYFFRCWIQQVSMNEIDELNFYEI